MDRIAATAHPKPRAILNGIQYLRGIAATAVVVFHASAQAQHPFWLGEAGVDLFFLLSGFLMIAITHPGSKPLAFLKDRIRRIVPAYWCVTTVVVCGALVGAFPTMQIDAARVLTSYLFIPSLLPGTNKPWPLLVPGWTLNFEMLFYLLFAATMLLRSQARQLIVLAVLFGSAVLVGHVWPQTSAIGILYTDPMLLEFLLGGAIGLWWKQERAFPRWVGWPSLVAALVMLVDVWTLQTDANRVVIFAVPMALVLVSVLAFERRSPIGAFRFPLLLGNASYSIYLWHTLAISAAKRIGERLLLPTGAVLPLGVLTGLIVGIIGYRLIERPFLHLFRPRRAPGIDKT